MKRLCFLLLPGLAIAALLLLSGRPGPQPQTLSAAPAVELYGAAASNSTDDGQAVSSFYRIDPATGAATLIASLGHRGVSAMDFDPATGILYAEGRRTSDNQPELFTIDPETGATHVIAPLLWDTTTSVGNMKMPDMSFRNADRSLFAWNENGDKLATINVTTGALTTFGSNQGGDGHGMAFSLSDVLYLGQISNFGTLNQTTGVYTNIGPLTGTPAGDDPRLAAMDAQPMSGVMYGALKVGFADDNPPSTTAYLVTVNLQTAAVTVLGQTVNGLDAIAFRVVTGEEQSARPNVGGAIGAILQPAPTRTAVAGSTGGTTAPALGAPRTGDAGLTDERNQVWYAFGALAIVAAAGAVLFFEHRAKHPGG